MICKLSVCQGLSSPRCMNSGVHELMNHVRRIELPAAGMCRHCMYAPATCKIAHQLSHAAPARPLSYQTAEEQHFQFTCCMTNPRPWFTLQEPHKLHLLLCTSAPAKVRM